MGKAERETIATETGVPRLNLLPPDAPMKDRLEALSAAIADELDALLGIRSRLLAISVEVNLLRR